MTFLDFSLKTVLWKIAGETEVSETARERKKLGSYRIKYMIANKKEVITNVTLKHVYTFTFI